MLRRLEGGFSTPLDVSFFGLINTFGPPKYIALPGFVPQNQASWVYLRDSRGLGPFRSSAWVPGVVRNVCGWIGGRRHVCGASCCTVPRLWRRAWQLLGRVDAPDQRLRTVPKLGWLPGSQGLNFWRVTHYHKKWICILRFPVSFKKGTWSDDFFFFFAPATQALGR